MANSAGRLRTRRKGEDVSLSTSQLGMRLYNERLALSLIRHHGGLSKAEFARHAGLSMQASAVIMRQLEGSGLLLKDRPTRNGVGQPATPLKLNPNGAFAIGCKVGRRSLDMVLMDFVGNVRRCSRVEYDYPVPTEIEAFVKKQLPLLIGVLSEDQQSLICGLGVAIPHEIWSFDEESSLPASIGQLWRAYDLQSRFQRIATWPVQISNDATAGCAAELIFGNRSGYTDFLYVFVGTLIGGGVVLHGSLFNGRAGYAGQMGSVFVGRHAAGAAGSPGRLINYASLAVLGRRLRNAGLDERQLMASDDWTAMGKVLTDWISEASEKLAIAISSAIAVIDFQAVVIDGGFPPEVRASLVNVARARFEEIDLQGMAPVDIVEGCVGRDARVLGAASLPLLATYSQDRHLLFEKAKSR